VALDALPARRRGGAAARAGRLQLVVSRKDDVSRRPVIGRAPSSACGSARRPRASSSRSSTDYVYQPVNARRPPRGLRPRPRHSSTAWPDLRVTFGRAKRKRGLDGSTCEGPGAVPGLLREPRSAMNELAEAAQDRPRTASASSTSPRSTRSWAFRSHRVNLLECFELGAEREVRGGPGAPPGSGRLKRDGPDARLGHGPGARGSPRRFPRGGERAAPRTTAPPRVAVRARRTSAPATYTILAQLASEKTGVPLGKVEGGARRHVASGRAALGRLDGDRLGGPRRSSRRADSAIASLLTVATADARIAVSRSATPDELAFEDGRVFVKADGRGGPRCRSRDVLRRAKPAPGHRQRQVRGDVRQSKAQILDALVRLVISSRSRGSRRIARLRVSRVVTVMGRGPAFSIRWAGRNQIEGRGS